MHDPSPMTLEGTPVSSLGAVMSLVCDWYSVQGELTFVDFPPGKVSPLFFLRFSVSDEKTDYQKISIEKVILALSLPEAVL